MNKDYIKESQAVYADDGKLMSYIWDNKLLVSVTLDPTMYKTSGDNLTPPLLCTNQQDKELAENIKKYYKRLLFSAVQGDNEFQTTVNSLLETDETPSNRIGFIACLPSVFQRDSSRNKLSKLAQSVDEGYLGGIGEQLLDLDCEIIVCQRSKNFDAFNIDAIINNKMVSWMSKYELKLGPAVIVKAKVKDHVTHYKFENTVTRLNYVKAAQ